MARSREPPSMSLRRYLPGSPGWATDATFRTVPGTRSCWPRGVTTAGPWLPRWGSARKCPAGRNHPSQGASPSPGLPCWRGPGHHRRDHGRLPLTGQLGRAAGPSGQGTVKTVIDWLVVALFSFLMVRALCGGRTPRGRSGWAGCSMACPASSTLRARSVPKRPRRVVRFAQLTHKQHEYGAGCRTPSSSHPGTWPYSGTVSAATLVPNGAWTTSGGHAGTYKRADRSVMGMLVFASGLAARGHRQSSRPLQDGKRCRRNLSSTAT
jgi:hypothetical protein